MQSHAEKYLVKKLVRVLADSRCIGSPCILNIGGAERLN